MLLKSINETITILGCITCIASVRPIATDVAHSVVSMSVSISLCWAQWWTVKTAELQASLFCLQCFDTVGWAAGRAVLDRGPLNGCVCKQAGLECGLMWTKGTMAVHISATWRIQLIDLCGGDRACRYCYYRTG